MEGKEMTKLGQGLIKGLSEAVEAEGKSMSEQKEYTGYLDMHGFFTLSSEGSKNQQIILIEKSYADALKAELEAVKEKLKLGRTTQRCGECGNVGMFMIGVEMADKLDRLAQANAILRNAMEFIITESSWPLVRGLARKALAAVDKLESESGE
jgi:hypothetical protein